MCMLVVKVRLCRCKHERNVQTHSESFKIWQRKLEDNTFYVHLCFCDLSVCYLFIFVLDLYVLLNPFTPGVQQRGSFQKCRSISWPQNAAWSTTWICVPNVLTKYRNFCTKQFEPQHDKINKMACAPCDDSDQPGFNSNYNKC